MAITHAATHATRLLAWYDRHRRTLPWRAPPGERTPPYLVWLSEIMLQQTTVATVGDYFHRFVKRWPTVEALAAAPIDDVLSAWAGLGYYARARNLHACAQAVVGAARRANSPRTRPALLALPGIGRYTAAAIRAIAFDQPASAVDGNVERVIARLYAIETPLPDAKIEIAARAAELVPNERAGDYAQAMMDLGATVCVPQKPALRDLPADAGLQGHAPRAWPRSCRDASPKADKPTRRGLAFVLMRKDGAVLLRKRPPKGLLGGMDEVPSSAWREGKLSLAEALKEAPVPANWKVLEGGVRHTFTHFHLELAVARAIATTAGLAKLAPGAAWVTVDKMTERALPTVMRKIIAHASQA